MRFKIILSRTLLRDDSKLTGLYEIKLQLGFPRQDRIINFIAFDSNFNENFLTNIIFHTKGLFISQSCPQTC